MRELPFPGMERVCIGLFSVGRGISAWKGRTLAGDRILRPELGEVDPKSSRKLALLKSDWKLSRRGDLGIACRRRRGRVRRHQSRQNRPL